MSEQEVVSAAADADTHIIIKFLIENWLNIISLAIGAAGTLFGAKALSNAKEEKEAYAFLFDLAEKNIDKKVTEESLNRKKEEVKRATEEIEELQRQIRRDIPKEARKAVLKDKLNSHYVELARIYKNANSIKEEISHLGESPEIPPDFLSQIEREISPEYLLREERENLKTYLTVFTTLAAISSAVLPWEFSRIAGGIFLAVGLFILIRLVKNIFKSASRKNQIRMAKIGYIVGFVLTAGLTLLFFYLMAEYGGQWDTSTEEYVLIGFVAFLTGLVGIPSGKLYMLKNRIDGS